jgi:hypothetical protein
MDNDNGLPPNPNVWLAIQEVVEAHRASAEETVREFNEIAEHYRERLEELSGEFETEVGPIRERFQEQREAFEEEMRELEVELPDLPEGEPPEEPGGWMFDSDRDFLDQTEEFQRRQRRIQ